jgi:hypothetical protein
MPISAPADAQYRAGCVERSDTDQWPFEFTGRPKRVTFAMHNDQKLDGNGVGGAEMARQ